MEDQLTNLRSEVEVLRQRKTLLQERKDLRAEHKELKRAIFTLKKGYPPFSFSIIRNGARDLWHLFGNFCHWTNNNIERGRIKNMNATELINEIEGHEVKRPQQPMDLLGTPIMDFGELNFDLNIMEDCQL